MPKETRENLIAEVARLKRDNEEWSAGSERRRQEFAKAFGWFKPNNYQERNPVSPSWEQIFMEVGKLLAARNFMDFRGKISELECAVEELKKKLLGV